MEPSKPLETMTWHVHVAFFILSRILCFHKAGLVPASLPESLPSTRIPLLPLRSETMAACIASISQAVSLRPPSFSALVAGNSQKQGGKLRTRSHVSPVAKFDLAPPPYPLDGLEPHISKTTLEFHWGKHHRAYVDNLNKQIDGTPLDGKTLEEVVVETYNGGSPGPQFNNAGQIWNHDFYWGSIQPNGGGKPTGELADLIDRDFGSYDEFVAQFKAAGATQFGSGWAWLVLKKDGKLGIEKTPNAVTPILWDSVPLLVIDVWEHAYYLDYQNRRPDYITTFVEKLISWESAAARLTEAKAKVNPSDPVVQRG